MKIVDPKKENNLVKNLIKNFNPNKIPEMSNAEKCTLEVNEIIKKYDCSFIVRIVENKNLIKEKK
jgi:hypothetical protein